MQCRAPTQSIGTASIRYGSGRSARTNERFGGRECVGPVTGDIAPIERRGYFAADTRCRDSRRQHAGRAGASVAGADPAQRYDAFGPYSRGDPDRAGRPRRQYARYLSRRPSSGGNISRALRGPVIL